MRDPRYTITVERKPGFWRWIGGTRYLVTLYEATPSGRRFRRLAHAGTLGSVGRTGQRLVVEQLAKSLVDKWETTIDFEVPRW